MSVDKKEEIQTFTTSMASLKEKKYESVPEEDDDEKAIVTNEPEEKEEPKNESCYSGLRNFLKFIDITLLKDPLYVNLMVGMSLAICAEMNFSLLTPLILNDFNFTTDEIARFMSITAITDIIFRFVAPFAAKCLKSSAKTMYMASLVLLIFTRTALTFISTFNESIPVAAALGVAKGFRTVYMSLLIPSYVPIEKLPNASGIQMVANGVIMMVAGSLLGLLRDIVGNYNKCIHVMNLITCITLVMWTVEAIYLKFIRK